MKRRPNYFEKGLKIAIVVLFIAVIAIAAINLYTTGTTQIQMLGVSLEVPDDGGFDLESKYNYASENYSRAYKRIQIIVSFLNGEISDGVTVTNN